MFGQNNVNSMNSDLIFSFSFSYFIVTVIRDELSYEKSW